MKRKKILAAVLAAAVLTGICGVQIVTKRWNVNSCFAGAYSVRGVDVSHHQGEIDWKELSGQNLDFAFIKATEGSSHEDEKFQKNWRLAGETDLFIGAYHFFSFDSSGADQADWYIRTVGELSGKLCPAVDVEYYGGKEADPPSRKETIIQLSLCLERLEEHYGRKPIIYTTYKVYRRYIEGNFEDYPLWIRNVYYPPQLDLAGKWQFWQYRDTAVLDGYKGEEKYIDLNVFSGTREELEEYRIDSSGEQEAQIPGTV